jgi:serine O-acetyltransferase
MWNSVKSDLYRYTGGQGLKQFLVALKYPGFVYFIFFRGVQFFSAYNPMWYVSRFFLWIFSYRFGFQIPYKVDIGFGLLIAHFGTVIINQDVKIGRNCNISPNVVIGQTNRGLKIGVPEIGDEVWIGTGSVIVGNIKIGSNVLISPNSFVNFDIPSNSIVIGSPMRIVNSVTATLHYINNKI